MGSPLTGGLCGDHSPHRTTMTQTKRCPIFQFGSWWAHPQQIGSMSHSRASSASWYPGGVAKVYFPTLGTNPSRLSIAWLPPCPDGFCGLCTFLAHCVGHAGLQEPEHLVLLETSRVSPPTTSGPPTALEGESPPLRVHNGHLSSTLYFDHCVHDGRRCGHTLASSALRCHHFRVQEFDRKRCLGCSE